MRKRGHGAVKAKSILVLLILSALFLIACTKRSDIQVDDDLQADGNAVEQVSEQPNEQAVDQDSKQVSEPVQKEVSGTDNTQPENITTEVTVPENGVNTIEYTKEATNNGGLYVGYKGNVYYRQYVADSFASEGLWGSYEDIAGSKKNMMYIKEDGTSEIAFQDTGSGNIYICNDRMYLEESSEDYIPIVYSVDLDGTNKQEIGKGRIKGIDKKTGTLICMLAKDDNSYELYKLSSSTGEVKKYDLKEPFSEFLALKDGVIYYNAVVDFETSQLGKIKLCSINIDGTDEKLLVDTDADLYDYGNYGTIIPCIQFVGDTIYFSYGSYAGTGYFYQGGRIAKVNTDGSNFTILLGNADSGYEYNNTPVGDIFYVTNNEGKEILYFEQSYENNACFALDLSTNKVAEANFTIHAEGKPFEYEKGVSIYQNASPKLITWIPFVDYNYLELDKKADLYTVKDIELCDNWVYYKLEANTSAPEASIGWREGYHRVKTKVIRKKLNEDTVEILFEY